MINSVKRIIKIDLPFHKRIIVLSDIHGSATYLDGVLKKVGYTHNDVLIIVGDLIEKGKESLKTLRYILRLKEENPHLYATIGNVDYDRIRDFFDDTTDEDKISFLDVMKWTKKLWKRGLLLDMLDEMGICLDDIEEANAPAIKDQMLCRYREELEYLWNLPAVLCAENYIFVHGGIPTDSLEDLSETDFFPYLKRNAFLNSDVSFEKNVIVGHWPVCLYHEDADSMNPIFDYKKHIISIDGGCGIKFGGQLNALIIPHINASMEEITCTYYDNFPILKAPKSQAYSAATLRFHYFDSKVELLFEESDYAKLRHLSSGSEFIAPKHFLYNQKDGLHCEDYSNTYLAVDEGDEISVLLQTSAGWIIKKDGVIGWYL